MRSTSIREKKLQMRDIARLAGVSTATVSRALNGSELINPETRQRIEELARSLNYTINQGAKSLRSGDNRTIAVVIPYQKESRQHISDPFFLGMLGSLADALTDRGYDMLLSRVDADQLNEMTRLFRTGRARALIVVGQWNHHDQLNEMARNRLPMVVWGAQMPMQLYCSVGSDNRSGGREATARLIAEGRRRILFMGDKRLPESGQRYEGYVEAHAQAGLVCDPALYVQTPFTPEAAEASLATFLQQGLGFDGVFAASDLIAIHAMGVLQLHGYAVPERVSVVGFDDVALAEHCFPRLSTMRQSVEEAGSLMVEKLEEILRGQWPQSIQLPAVWIERDSTLPIKSS